MSDDPAVPRFSDARRRALCCVLDEIVPPSADGRMPGAGLPGVVEQLQRSMQRDPALGPAIAAGLEALDALARRRGATDFASLPVAARAAALEELSAAQPGFVPALVFPTYAGYYREPRVLAGLGLEPRPPFPQGHELAPFDASLLEKVRRRAPFWRKA